MGNVLLVREMDGWTGERVAKGGVGQSEMERKGKDRRARFRHTAAFRQRATAVTWLFFVRRRQRGSPLLVMVLVGFGKGDSGGERIWLVVGLAHAQFVSGSVS